MKKIIFASVVGLALLGFTGCMSGIMGGKCMGSDKCESSDKCASSGKCSGEDKSEETADESKCSADS